MKPDFIVIGAARSGTTSLYQYLDAHPEIYLSPVKELNFFSNEKYWSKGFKWYESNFSGAGNTHRLSGEISPSYTKAPFTEDVVKRIHDYHPEIKLIYVVRNPIERFISHYLHRVHRGYESRDIAAVLDCLEKESIAYQGLYYFQIQKYLERFRADQLLVIPFESIKTSTAQTMQNIYHFLGVDPLFNTKELTRIHNANKTIIRKNNFGLAIMRFYHEHIEQKNIPYTFKKVFIYASNIGGQSMSKIRLTKNQLATLENFYKDDAYKLNKEFGIQTSQWFEQQLTHHD